MAEDDLISAMWRSLVPTVDGSVRSAGDHAEPSPVDYGRNPHEMVLEDVTTYYAEPGQDHRVHVYEDMEPINHWNEQQMIVHGNPAPAAETSAAVEMQVPSNSELVYYVPDLGVEPIDYDWNRYVMVNGYPEAEEVVKDIVVVHSQAAKEQAQAHHQQEEDGSSKVNIFRVPPRMRKGNAESYDPQLVSIGPYHYKPSSQHNLDEAEGEKWFSLNEIRTGTWFSSNECIGKIEEIVQEVKECYEDQEGWEWDSLEMILDACFILYCFRILPSAHLPLMKRKLRSLKQPEQPEARGTVLVELRSHEEREQPQITLPLDLPFDRVPISDFTHDISLLENQIPFRMMEIVYEIAIEDAQEKLPSLKRQVAENLHKVLSLYPTAIMIDNEETDDMIPQFEHILDYYHKYFAPSEVDQVSSQQTQGLHKILNNRYRATEMIEAGVVFKNIEGAQGRSLLDIEFENGTLKIPTLTIDGRTLSLFRNIIAYEQKLGRRNPSDNYFTAYVKFMANLIITDEDVSLLTRKKIIVNHLGDYKNILDLFSKLLEGVSLKFDDNNYLMSTYIELDEYCNSSYNIWIADLRRKYCKTPWVFLGLVAGIILATCTIISAVASVFDMKKKN